VRLALLNLANYKVSISLSYLWNGGSLILGTLIIQVLTGILLAFWYIPNVELAFDSLNLIMREVSGGWLLRYVHTNGASLIFFVIYLHVLRALFYKSYKMPRHLPWLSGMALLLLTMAAAFLGYVLPWASMSYWAATVITSLISVMPYFGTDILELVWGGFGLGQPTLSRIFTLHFLSPIFILFVICLHLYELHIIRSTDPLGGFSKVDVISFHPAYTLKDVVGYIFLFIIFGFFVFWGPNLLSHPLNYIVADPFVTPPHIVPEWYFLPFYGLLRSIPNKLLGVLALVFSIFLLVVLPFFQRSGIEIFTFKPFHNIWVWLFLVNVLLLGWAAEHPAIFPYVGLGQFSTGIHFILFITLPLIEEFEHFLITVVIGDTAVNN
jgi:quinol-cytochrome oxidoreductase complex cytochrome b subunit